VYPFINSCPVHNDTSPDNTVMELRQIGWGGMDWIHLAQDRDQWRALENIVIYLGVP
jgi:hypothetical protein